MDLARSPAALAGALTAALLTLLSGCEEHRGPATRGAPEFLHDALSGDIAQQDALATCYVKAGACVGLSPDPALGCAWRGVRLASQSPALSLADSEAFAAACANPDESVRQRESIAMIDLAARVYGRRLGALDNLLAASGSKDALYPSLELVRDRVNQTLGQMGQAERLPAFAARRPSDQTTPVSWSSCGPTICLDADTPPFGGGVQRYRVSVKATASGDPSALAARLATAGLDASATATILGQASTAQINLGPVCWFKGSRDAVRYAGAARGPCPAAPVWPRP